MSECKRASTRLEGAAEGGLHVALEVQQRLQAAAEGGEGGAQVGEPDGRPQQLFVQRQRQVDLLMCVRKDGEDRR